VGERDCLLVIDNCEHVLSAAADLCATLLRACPNLRILATSRESLDIGGEVAWTVPTLPSPAGVPATVDILLRFDAAKLFVERATTASPGFEPTADDIADIAAICASLDGIPLAIELAAARLRTLSLAQVATRLDDRLRLLVSGRRDVQPRQRTLPRLEAEHDEYRAALAWLVESGDVDGAARLSGALWPFWHHAYFAREGRAWLRRVLALEGAAPEWRVRAIVGSAYLAFLED